MGLFSTYPGKSTLSRGRLESLVLQRTAELQALSQRLLKVQDEERRRVARDLHDSVGQTLTALKINIALLEHKLEQGQCASRVLSDMAALADQALQEIRTTSYLLHPPLLDELGFVPAARWFGEGFGRRSGIKVKLHLLPESERLPVTIETALFRVLQEGLTNVHRHSGASEVEVRFQHQAEHAILEISDSGCGMPRKLWDRLASSEAGVGLVGMRERMTELNGKLEIESNGHGTRLRAIVPIIFSSAQKECCTEMRYSWRTLQEDPCIPVDSFCFTVSNFEHPPECDLLHHCTVKSKDLTPEQLISVPCNTCGAAIKEPCELHSGALRSEPHRDRRLSAADAADMVSRKTSRNV